MWDTTRRRGYTRQLELSQQVVVLGASMLSFVHLDKHTGLVVRICREDFGLYGRDGGVAPDKSSHDTTSRLNTEGKGGNIEEKKFFNILRGSTAKNGSMDGSTIGNGLVWVDALVGLLAVKEVGNEFDDTGDTGRTTDQDDFMNVRLVNLGVTENPLNGVKSTTEEILAKFLETGTSDRGIEVDTLEE